MNGKYVFGDYRKTKETETPTGSLFVATPTDNGLWDLEDARIENHENGFVGGYVLAIGRDNDGELYVLTTNNPGGDSTGKVQRIEPAKNPQKATTTAGNATGTTTGNATGTAANTTATNTTAGNATGTSNATTGTANMTTAETGSAMTGTAAETPASTSGKTTGATSTNESTNSSNANNGTAGNETSGESGPGFGALAAIGALAIGAARYLRRRDD